MDKDELVVKSNSLIRSRYDYTLAELRLVITIASMIEAADEDFREYSVPAVEYAELMDAKRQNIYQALQKLGEMLLSKPLKIPDSDDDGFLICNWFSSYRYKKGEGTITVKFDPELKPHLLQLKEMFTKYKLENILRFKSAYSIRIYEIAKSWEARGDFTYSLSEFKDLIGATKKYSAYYDFKRYVLQRSIKEINALSDIKLSFKEKKLSRKVTDLVFTVKAKKQEKKDWMKTQRSFIAHIRKAYQSDPDRNFFPAVIKNTKNGDLKISKFGKIYFVSDEKGTLDIDNKKADTIWKWLYDGVKNGEVKLEPEPTSNQNTN